MTVENFVIKRNFNRGSASSGLLSSLLDEERQLISKIVVLDLGEEKRRWDFSVIIGDISS